MPPELHMQEIKIDFQSVLAQAAKLINTRSIQSTAGFVGQLAQYNQAALDKLNTDECIDLYGDAVGAPATIIRGKDEVDQIRAARQKQMAVQQQQAAVNQQIDNAQKLAQTPLNPETALGRLEGMGSVGGQNQ
jgi:hypothetical protein